MASENQENASIPPTSDESDTSATYINDLNEFLLSFRVVHVLHEKAKIPPIPLFLTLLTLVGALFGYFFGIIRFIQLLGFIGPAYVTVSALDGDSEVDILRWIKYWVIFSICLVSEPVSDTAFSWVPYFPVLKVLFWVWICLPFTGATTVIYDLVLARFFTAHRDHIDKGIHAVKFKSIQATRELRGMSTQLLRQASASIAMAAITGLSQSSSQSSSRGDKNDKGFEMVEDVVDEDGIPEDEGTRKRK